MSFWAIVPMAFVMVAGPQILSAILLATTENWRGNSAAFVSGAAVSISICVIVAFALGIGVSHQGASDNAMYIVVIALLLLAGLHVFKARKTAKPPKWMGKLEGATPRASFRLGFLLLGVFPTDILTSFAVGSFLSTHGDPWSHYLPFLGVTLLLLALPSIALILLGGRAASFLPRARDWMNTHSWVVNEIVIVFFVLITASNL